MSRSAPNTNLFLFQCAFGDVLRIDRTNYKIDNLLFGSWTFLNR
uniref:Uncharacterized protein n=1 Tax=Picea glauca TaxID=3330 RepID=A0A124GMZ6_PICGL|nr:hypothetical protein ABT39_MTgene5441 [Picea glauca]